MESDPSLNGTNVEHLSSLSLLQNLEHITPGTPKIKVTAVNAYSKSFKVSEPEVQALYDVPGTFHNLSYIPDAWK